METKAKCLIVDDEPLAIEVLKSHLGKLKSIEIAGTAADAIEAFDFLNNHRVDLMFLDIHMPEMKGTELIKSLKNPPAVILTTAHRQYALEGYDLNVLDYLLKPVSFERFMQAIEKFFTTFNHESEVFLHNQGTNEEFLYLREKNVIHKIPLSEIMYAESMGDNLIIHTPERVINSRCTITSIETLLSENGFIRIHRSFIVSIKRITSFSPVSVFIGKKEFPIGISYKKVVFNKLNYDGFLNK
ncbi:MAG: response regulator transcription factor [Prolixibacteraceae bacterium]|nr:response regulator transcription factor [Prolixibacteraceae bacterium]MBN2773186.1 response regulator transcription factor [Prolixibacteraceae bacterium]